MRLGRVLLIEGNAAFARPLVQALEREGFAVATSPSARDGFQRACDIRPDCIVVDAELPDIDGLWVVRRVRTEASSVSRIPIVVLGVNADPAERAQATQVGADVWVQRPTTTDEIVAHVKALIGMSQRLRGTEPPPSSTSLTAAVRGDLAQFPLSSMLMMFELERRSGEVDVVASSGKRAKLVITEGLFAESELDGQTRPALEVLREVLSWRAGRFAFSPRDAANLPPPRASVGAVVLEAMRLEDEARKAAPSIPPPASVPPRSSLLPPSLPADDVRPVASRPPPPPPPRRKL